MVKQYGVYSVERAQVISDVVDYLKRNGFVLQGGQQSQPVFFLHRQHIAKTTSTITARSGMTAGSGTATLLSLNGTAIEDWHGSKEITIYNLSSGSIDTDRIIYVGREYATAQWVVLFDDCGE